nr:MAG TPA: hypothetical protein [Caudoviricetes sp.]
MKFKSRLNLTNLKILILIFQNYKIRLRIFLERKNKDLSMSKTALLFL